MRAFILIALAVAGGCKKPNSAGPVAKLESVSSKVTVTPAMPVLEPPPLDPPAPDKPEPEKPASVPRPAVRPAPSTAGPAVAKRAVKEEHLRYIHIFVEYASGASGKMPSTETTYAALKQESPETAALVYEKSIVLHAAKNREEIWAYEAKALESSGWVATNGGVETMDAATLKRRLGR